MFNTNQVKIKGSMKRPGQMSFGANGSAGPGWLREMQYVAALKIT